MLSAGNMTDNFPSQSYWGHFHRDEDELTLPAKHQVSRRRQDHTGNLKPDLAYCSTKARSKALRKMRMSKTADILGGAPRD